MQKRIIQQQLMDAQSGSEPRFVRRRRQRLNNRTEHQSASQVITSPHPKLDRSSTELTPTIGNNAESEQRWSFRLNYKDIILLAVFLFFTISFSIRSHAAETNLYQAGNMAFHADSETLYSPGIHTRVDMVISGMIAEVTVEQHFRNPSLNWVEGRYDFPLPDNAAVNRMTLTTSSRVIESEIREKSEAKDVYEDARREGRQASLVTQNRPDLFSTQIANIAPGENVSARLVYNQTLDYNNGVVSIRFPMTYRQRFNLSTEAEPAVFEPNHVQAHSDAQGLRSDDDSLIEGNWVTGSPATLINPVELSVRLDAGFELVSLQSHYHDIDISKQGSNQIISLSNGLVEADRDFELSWTLKHGSAPKASAFRQRIGDSDYAMMMVIPPLTEYSAVLPRSLTFVIDTSGSMEGASMLQAKESVLMALGSLNDQDRFNLIEFNSTVSRLFDQSVPVNNQTLGDAIAYVDQLLANGGTRIDLALDSVLDQQTHEGYQNQFIFITDGSIENESRLFGRIEQRLGDRRLYTVGIGSAPNRFFMRKAAEFGRGTFTLISSLDEVSEKMDALLKKIEQPVMNDICIHWPGYSESYPSRVPDLHLGEALLVIARLDIASGDSEVCGQTEGENWMQSVKLGTGPETAGLGVLWGQRRIESLLDDLALGADEVSIRSEVISTALEHRLLSPYTSFVAVDRKKVVNPMAHLQLAHFANVTPDPGIMATPGMLAVNPASQAGTTLSLPQTATPALMHTLLGLVFIVVGLAIVIRLKDSQ